MQADVLPSSGGLGHSDGPSVGRLHARPRRLPQQPGVRPRLHHQATQHVLPEPSERRGTDIFLFFCSFFAFAIVILRRCSFQCRCSSNSGFEKGLQVLTRRSCRISWLLRRPSYCCGSCYSEYILQQGQGPNTHCFIDLTEQSAERFFVLRRWRPS